VQTSKKAVSENATGKKAEGKKATGKKAAEKATGEKAVSEKTTDEKAVAKKARGEKAVTKGSTETTKVSLTGTTLFSRCVFWMVSCDLADTVVALEVVAMSRRRVVSHPCLSIVE